MEALKITEKIIRENAFEHKKKKPYSAFKQLGPGKGYPIYLKKKILRLRYR